MCHGASRRKDVERTGKGTAERAEELLAGLRGRRYRSRLGALENRVGAVAADVEHRQHEGGNHENDCRPSSKAGQHVCCSARPEGCLRALPAEGTGEVGRTALLHQHDSDEKQAHDHVDDDDKVKKNLHVASCFRPLRAKSIGAERGT